MTIVEGPTVAPGRGTVRGDVAFWAMTVLLGLYVALCTGNRDVVPDGDAWEHLRAIHALAADAWHPGNPTFASPVPSVRYSPYFVAQAAIVRATGIDAYRVLSAAAVVNTLLLCIGLRALLGAWSEQRAAPLALACVVGLWGCAPKYAGTTALADLPWHAVNPSAFSFALALFALALARRWDVVGGAWRWAAIVPLLTCATLDHGMVGAFALMAIGITALLGGRRRWLGAGLACATGIVVIALCCAWPLYPFAAVLRAKHDAAYWVSRGIILMMLGAWCAPAMLLAIAARSASDRPLVRTFVTIGFAGVVATAVAFIVSSPVLARFAMPATFFLQVAVAVWITHAGGTDWRTWRDAIGNLLRNAGPAERRAPSVLMLFFAIAIAYGLVPQLHAIVHEPYLAKPLVARLRGQPDPGGHLKPIYDALLAPVGERDVVLADSLTSWPIPSSRGRIVAAAHYERLILDQPRRDADVERFFAADCDAVTRDAIVAKYDVKWIVLNLAEQPASVAASLLGTWPERGRVGTLVLLDVRARR